MQYTWSIPHDNFYLAITAVFSVVGVAASVVAPGDFQPKKLIAPLEQGSAKAPFAGFWDPSGAEFGFTPAIFTGIHHLTCGEPTLLGQSPKRIAIQPPACVPRAHRLA
jgi:hypothetical protein